jgi:hypothetical protein
MLLNKRLQLREMTRIIAYFCHYGFRPRVNNSSSTSHIMMLDVYVLQHVVKSVVKTVYVHTFFMIVVVTAVMDISAGMLSENPQEFLSTYMCM